MVLADNVGFRSVVREGREAVFLTDQRPAVWADTVIGLVADVERRAAMQRAGLDRAAEFAWPIVARQELDVYERVTGISEERAIRTA
jgi:glycosyltransferase involved in cell wall biosynthesis